MTALIPPALFEQLSDNGWRSPILIKGNKQLRYNTAQQLIQQQKWQTGVNPDTLNETNKHIQAYLGQELDYVWLDSSSFLDIDVLCALAGCIKHGGALILTFKDDFIYHDATTIGSLAYPHNQESHQYSYYMQRLWQQSQNVKGCIIIDDSILNTVSFEQVDIKQKFVKPTNFTAAQQIIINELTKLHKNGHYFIKADRGRGKSTVLAALVNNYLHQGLNVTITAPAKRCLSTVWSWLDKWQSKTENLTFYPPDELAQQLNTNSNNILIVDEAAALPSQLLKTVSQKFNWVIYATTEQGYEGSGKGLSQHFVKQIEASNQLVQTFELTAPIRWAVGDPVENWLNSICMPNNQPSISKDNKDTLSFRFVQQSELVRNNSLITAIFSLLTQAHYRTTPSDLKHMLDSPALKLCVAQNEQGEVIAAILLSVEGQLDQALTKQIMNGTRRPNGHLTPQIVSAQSGILAFSQLRGLRIVRIAVTEQLRNLNIASSMLEWLEHQPLAIDYLSTSFAASITVANFWHKNDYKLARVSTTPEHHSGLYSTLCIKMLKVEHLPIIENIQQQCAMQLIYFQASQYQTVEGELLWLWHTSLRQYKQPALLFNLSLIEGFALHSSNLHAALPDLHNFCLIHSKLIRKILPKGQQNLLADIILKRHSASFVASNYGFTGQKQVIRALRQIVASILKHMDSVE